MSDIRRVVTGFDAEDRAVVQFDSQLALEPGPFGINSVDLWITDSYPPGFSFTHDTVATPGAGHDSAKGKAAVAPVGAVRILAPR